MKNAQAFNGEHLKLYHKTDLKEDRTAAVGPPYQ